MKTQKAKYTTALKNTYFNQKYLRKNIIPNSAKIKLPNTSPDSKFTQQK
jgi:hypothetical protein